MDQLDEMTEQALKVDMVVDITTTGCKTGLPRSIEIWAHLIDGQVVIMGAPGRRSWYANLLAHPEFTFTFQLQQGDHGDTPATARPVTDEAERRTIFARTKETSGFEQRMALDVESWVMGSCLVTVTFRGS